jgi:glycosyltransferase involved in cell wall biosynthesis
MTAVTDPTTPRHPTTASTDGQPLSTAGIPGLVSVVIPMYNAGKTLERALRSVALQDYPNLEVVAVDDGSKDETLAIAESAKSWLKNLKVVRHEKNKGASEAYNTGIRESRGEFVAFLDADDEFLAGKISRQVEAMRGAPRVVLLTHDVEMVSIDGERWRFFERVTTASGPDAWLQLMEWCFVATPSVFVRREHLLKAGFFVPGIVVGEDLDVWIRVAVQGEILTLPDVLARVHRVPTSIQALHPDGDARWALPMIEGHLSRLGTRVPPARRRRIVGLRSFFIAHDYMSIGRSREAIAYFIRAIRNGHRPLRCVLLIGKALMTPKRGTKGLPA